ncbi:hypothetical protein [Yellowstone lake phycodnavirus 3]|uniref:hypothetical protein n=1 Tax=Yellowstone lake phycodnavirus 3 TaxID=1586715 RepID=UPI0006EB783F|nr:hypothetical protein AR677_gp088 [Yellowstone lake phycodnavirus 3]BAT22587.1 hypothetical protein [Yellowstone lake phycodnavirus 3]
MDPPTRLVGPTTLIEKCVNSPRHQTRDEIEVHYILNLKKGGPKNTSMASELLVFYPQGRHLYIEFLGARYIENQPKTPEEARAFMNSVAPVVQQLDAYVEKHGLKEIIELNLKDVPISKLNSETATHLLKLMVELRPDKGLLEKIRVTNSNPVFNMIYKGVKTSLPSKITDLVEIEADSKFF